MAVWEFLKKKKTVELQVVLTNENDEKGFYEKQRGFIEELKSSLERFAVIIPRCIMSGQTVVRMYVELDQEEFAVKKIEELKGKYFPNS